MADLTTGERNALAAISISTDPDRLRNLISNARRQGATLVEKAAFERLCLIQPEAAPGTVEHDVWASVHALEQMLRDERGKTVRLSRTRQKITRDGEAKTVADLTMKPEPSAGFFDLVSRGHANLTFEAVVLRHPDVFDREVHRAASSRLEAAGFFPSEITPDGKDT